MLANFLFLVSWGFPPAKRLRSRVIHNSIVRWVSRFKELGEWNDGTDSKWGRTKERLPGRNHQHWLFNVWIIKFEGNHNDPNLKKESILRRSLFLEKPLALLALHYSLFDSMGKVVSFKKFVKYQTFRRRPLLSIFSLKKKMMLLLIQTMEF